MPSRSTVRLAVVGLGGRGSFIARSLCQADPTVRVTAVVDRELDRTRDAIRALPDTATVRLFPTLEPLLRDADQYDGFIVATRCDSHTPVAVQLAAHTKAPIFLEKPVAISWDQLRVLREAFYGRDDSVLVSFPLRLTKHVRAAAKIIRSGRIGPVTQLQAVNNASYGGVYFARWYRDYATTGGLWLQKATHDFDYVNVLMDASPVQVSAMHSRRAFGGRMPEGLWCSKCPVTDTCPESPENLRKRGDDGGMCPDFRNPAADHACAFGKDILHQDAGSAMLLYHNGAHANYTQNFVVRRSAGRRGATVVGYEGTIVFDWPADTLRVIDHHTDGVEEIDIKTDGTHGGGDAMLVANFLDMLHGRAASKAPLTAGLLSAAMCLAARDSAEKRAWQQIPSFALRPPPNYPMPVIEPAATS